MRTVIIDCRDVDSEEALWQDLSRGHRAMGRGYFGGNLDAFWDALTGGGPGYPGEVALRFVNTSKLKTIGDGTFYEALARFYARRGGHSSSPRVKVDITQNPDLEITL